MQSYTESDSQRHLLDLPVEIIFLIIRELDFWTILQLRKTCVALEGIVESFKTVHAKEWDRIRNLVGHDIEGLPVDGEDDEPWDEELSEEEPDYLDAFNDEIPSFGSNYDEEWDDS